MSVIKQDALIAQANQYQRPLKHRTVFPCNTSALQQDPTAFQGVRVISVSDFQLPFRMNSGDRVILDFGDHCVGYLHFALDHFHKIRICDSPLKLRFRFGEFPLELSTPPEAYHGTLGSGWLQLEDRSMVFMPYSGTLERRYAFRYLQIERLDSGAYPIQFTDLHAQCVSAVDLTDAVPYSIPDSLLQKIYDMSLKTLKECEQSVFEDGPKRDRRLWIGDLRLQALTDYGTFRNLDLIRRCICLFAGYRNAQGLVAPCIFPDSPPCMDQWIFADYSLFLISCLFDYAEHTGDLKLTEEIYPIALEQAQLIADKYNAHTNRIDANPFIDWCPDLDRSTALLGVFLYTLRQLRSLTCLLSMKTDWIDAQIQKMAQALSKCYDPKQGLFLGASGQISWHSQVWAVLSGTLSAEESRALLLRMQTTPTPYTMRTPYMLHYYLEALVQCGLSEQALQTIRDYWGKMVEFGFDCCPEIFNPASPLESPYSAPEINSACHAWSCTPAYWIPRLCQ